MATAPITAWDEKGNPVKPQTAATWDEKGNPLPVSLEKSPNPYSEAGAAANRPIAPVPLPGQGQRIMGRTWDSELAKQPEEPLGAPIAPLGTAMLSAPKFIGGLAGGLAASKGSDYLSDKLGLSDTPKALLGGLSSLIGGGVGAGAGAGAEDLFSGVKESTGRNLRVQPTADNSPTTGTIGRTKSVSTLKPGVQALAGAFKLVGGPKIANALIPDYPEPVGPFRRIASGPTQFTAPGTNEQIPVGSLPSLDVVGRAIAEKAARGLTLTEQEEAILERQVLQHFTPEASVESAARQSGKIYAGRGTSFRPTNEQINLSVRNKLGK